ncbi:MAG: DUF6167 family protein [Nocardioides sp.]|nr:DUF6167 family protein [Nocardioides sp.]
MGRPLWFAAGAGVGVYAAARARRLADTLTADGIRDRLHGWRMGARLFAEEVRQGRTEREVELREQLGLVPPHARELHAGGTHRREVGPPVTEEEN